VKEVNGKLRYVNNEGLDGGLVVSRDEVYGCYMLFLLHSLAWFLY